MQGTMAKVSMFSAYCVGLPLAYFFGIFLDFGVVGLWAGLSGGPICNCLVQTYVRARTDWEEQARAAQERSRKKKARLQAAAAEAEVQAVEESDDESEREGLIASDAKASEAEAAESTSGGSEPTERPSPARP